MDYLIYLTIFAEFPTAKAFSGIFILTKKPAPIAAFLPIVTPIKIVAFPPIQTLSPILIGLAKP